MKEIKNFLSSSKQNIVIWIFINILIAVSFIISVEYHQDSFYESALLQARGSFKKDLSYRLWFAIEGGVYVPISDFTPPNPYLDVPLRDVETKEGLRLTLVNPAYMTRMVHGIEMERQGIISHITSLKPLNPVNKPDEWEEKALKELEKGVDEKHELTLLNNEKYLRYLSALKVEEACLKCHANQGYKVGDVIGAIGVSIPFKHYEKLISEHNLNVLLIHLGVAVITFVILFVGAIRNYKNKIRLIDKDEEIKEIVRDADIGYWSFDILNNKLIINKSWADRIGFEFSDKGKEIDYYLSMLHEDDVQNAKQILENLRNGKITEISFEHRLKYKDGSYRWFLSKGKVYQLKKGIPSKISGIQLDIDKEKKTLESLLRYNNEFKLIFEHSPIPTSISSLEDGKFFAVNKAWEEVSGYKSSEVIGKTSLELNMWKNPSDRKNLAEQIIKDFFVENLETLIRKKSGEVFLARFTATLIDIDNKKYIIAKTRDISKEKRFERKLKKEKELYSYFNYIHSMIDELDEQNFYDLSIEYAVKLTESKVGFFHQVSEDQKEIILTAWNQQAKEFCKADYKFHYPINEAGNWIDCLKTKKAVVYNDYKNSPNQKGLPLGHIQVEKFMSIATYVNDKPFLVFGVGNKEEDYDEVDISNLELFSFELSKLIEKRNFSQKLKENERFITNLINNLPGFAYRCKNDENWTMLYLSENTLHYTGYKTEELLNNRFISYNDMILPKFRQSISDKIQKAIEADTPYELEYQIVKKDGKIVWVWERGKGVKDKNGNLFFLEGFITEIDEKKKLQDAISENEKKYRLLVEEMEQGLAVHQAIYDDNGEMINYKFLDMNKSFVQMLGIKKEEFVNKTVLEVLPETEKYWIDTYAKVVKTGEAIEFENYSKEFDKFFKVLAYKNQENQFATIVTDITKQKKLQLELEESNNRFLRLAQNSKDIVFKFNLVPERGFEYVNDVMNEISGYSKEELNANPELLTKLIHPEDLPKVLEVSHKTEEEEVRKPFVLRWITKNGKIKWIEHRLIPLYDDKKQIISYEGILRDITEQVEYEMMIVDSEKKYRSLFENMTSGFILYKVVKNENDEPEDLLIAKANQYLADSLGIKLENLIGKNLKEALPGIENDSVDWIGIYSNVALTGQNTTFEAHSSLLNKYFSVSAYQSEPNYCAVTFVDITEKKLAEQELKNQKKRLENIIQSTEAGTWEWNIQTGEIIINERLAEMLGYNYDELKSYNLESWHSLFHPEDLEKDYVLLNKHIKGEADIYEFEHRIKTKSGDWKWIFARGKILSFTEDGNPEWMFGIYLDIEEKKKKEEQINILSSVVEQSPVSVVITDKNADIVFVNKYFCEKTGYAPEDVLGKNASILLSGKHSKSYYEDIWRQLGSGLSWDGNLLNIKKNGELFWERVIISPLRNEQNQIVYYVAVKDDITEEIKLNKELDQERKNLEKLVEKRTEELNNINKELVEQIKKERELENQLQEALLKEKEMNQLKVRFFAAVSHEFRTPLAGILTSTQMIQRYGKKWSEDKLLNHFHNIEKTVNHLTKLLDDISLISKADREILKNQPQEENIEELIKNIINQHYPSIQKGRKINFINQCPSLTYKIDPKLLNHIVGNLLSNAIKFGFENTDVNLSLSEVNRNLVIKVEDKGVGIPENEISRIFEPFYRTSNSASIKGTGLGLNIVKRCIEILKGNIEVESKINVGTIFTVRIPINE